ncbi:MAG TPA: M28 family peptidase [Blastocatellia bacterium]|nr:M28 family peptidase [Blastocatellia bacterium]
MSTRLTAALLLSLVVSCQGGINASPPKPADFHADRAFEHAKKLVAFGPRPSGSDAIAKTQAYIEDELKSYGLNVSEDAFTATTPKGQIAMKNIIGHVEGSKPGIVIVSGHYDTKLQPGFLGANDGASSAATVLELARVFAKSKPEYSLWFVFFDGEEAVEDWSAMNGEDNTYGSRHMAAKMKADGTLNRVKALVLVDMIGDKQLNIKREGESTPWMVELFWNTAKASGYEKAFVKQEQFISDDHLPFRDAGVPVLDLIDFDYGPQHSYWHTNDDTLDKISGESMKTVGDVIILTMPELFKRLNNPSAQAKKPDVQ